MGNQLLTILIVIGLVAGAGWYYLHYVRDTVPIEARYDGRLVYTMEASQDPAPFAAHCSARGGTFNQCGSPCAPGAEACIQACAFTCELPQNATQDPIISDWETYTNSKLHFSLRYPKELELSRSATGTPDERVVLSVWGPTQEEFTEFYDGISISFSTIELDGKSAKELAQAELDALKIHGITVRKTVAPITLAGTAGYEYSFEGVGTFTEIYLPQDEQTALKISYSAPDPTHKGFQDVVNRVLSTLRLTK